jgi:peptide-methionine (S)-S-oxide reductase
VLHSQPENVGHVDQQYLAKNPNGYRCNANTGVPFPANA